ncbi:MAG: hypothetical protein Q8902_13305 [Bacteroidota bacterium]|nr:hypothetical protein [Bacteroidota bacterium]
MARLLLLQLGRRSVLNLRTLLHVPKSENPKALALFLMGLIRANERVSANWATESSRLAMRLADVSLDSGGWGYPFPWQSRTHFLGSNTPNIVTTSFAGMALLEWQRLSLMPDGRVPIGRAAEYIVNRIPRLDQDGVAFGYAESDPQIVFNASLLGAEFLVQAGRLLERTDYIELAHRAARFVVNHQRTDGSWPYGLEPSQHWIDSFHTGYTVLSLKTIADVVGDDVLHDSAVQGFEYYRNNFIEPDFAVRYFPNGRYPIDSHALGQAMVTLCVFGDVDTARNVARWSCEHMRSETGYFYYQRRRLLTNRIGYMRWSNAWMFRGLCEVLSHE